MENIRAYVVGLNGSYFPLANLNLKSTFKQKQLKIQSVEIFLAAFVIGFLFINCHVTNF